MTFAELERKLKKAGWKKGEGTKHSYMYHPDSPGLQILIGRHKSQEVPTGTLRKILKDAGLK